MILRAEEVDPPTRCTDHHDGPVSSYLSKEGAYQSAKTYQNCVAGRGIAWVASVESFSLAHSKRPENEALNHRHFSHLTSSVNYVPIFRQPNHGSASQSQQLLQLAVFGSHSLPAVRRSSVQGVWSESDKLFIFAT